ncbi:uncharacterized protein LOC122963477 isoform X3 [Acropora millepora]|uniref:uncharacterized protein LOC122963477 isoform X3 n=1 Tax=Acropora millepora TaxID=45264 RepID=UPI001CF24E4C|nr:uncharacterized protein LOC122963477 isoform X3 [Acropora millepora]
MKDKFLSTLHFCSLRKSNPLHIDLISEIKATAISMTYKPSTETAHLAVTLISFTEERQVPYVRYVNDTKHKFPRCFHYCIHNQNSEYYSFLFFILHLLPLPSTVQMCDIIFFHTLNL